MSGKYKSNLFEINTYCIQNYDDILTCSRSLNFAFIKFSDLSKHKKKT